jgi:hypothetical protein
MSYNKEDLERKAIDAINKHKLYFIQDVIAYLPCASSTFYLYELEKSETIKDALHKVKTKKKVLLRDRWEESDNATLQVGLMKLLASDEELRKLSMATQEIKTEGDMNLNVNIIEK